MKWTLSVERKDIEVKIDKDEFILETSNCKMQFEIGFPLAMKMLDQLKAIATQPYLPKGLAETVNGKTLIIDYVLSSGDYWRVNLQYGDDNFYAELTKSDVNRIGTVLNDYLNT